MPPSALLIATNRTRRQKDGGGHRIVSIALFAAVAPEVVPVEPEPPAPPKLGEEAAGTTASNDTPPAPKPQQTRVISRPPVQAFRYDFPDDEIQPGGVATIRVPTGSFMAVATFDDGVPSEIEVVTSIETPCEVGFSR